LEKNAKNMFGFFLSGVLYLFSFPGLFEKWFLSLLTFSIFFESIFVTLLIGSVLTSRRGKLV